MIIHLPKGRATDNHLLADPSGLLEEEVTGAALLLFQTFLDSLAEQADQL